MLKCFGRHIRRGYVYVVDVTLVCLFFSVRSSVGIELWSTTALTAPYVVDPKFARDESKYCRAVAFSGDGRYFAWVNGVR